MRSGSGAGGRGYVAVDQAFGTIDGQGKPLFAEDSHLVANEVIVLEADLNPRLPLVEDLRRQTEGAGQEFANGDGLSGDNRKTPEGRTQRALRITDDVTAFAVLQGFDTGPVDVIQDMTSCRNSARAAWSIATRKTSIEVMGVGLVYPAGMAKAVA